MADQPEVDWLQGYPGFVPEDDSQKEAGDFPEAEQENADANVAINRKVFAIEVAVGMKHLFKDKDEFFAFVEELETRLT